MKKILFFLEYPLDLIGGVQLCTQTICKQLVDNKLGFEPVVVTPNLMNRNQSFDFEVIEIGEVAKGFLEKILLPIKFLKIILKNRPYIIHAQMPLSAMILGLMKTLKIINQPLIFTDASFLPAYSKNSRRLFNFVYKSFDKVTCTTGLNVAQWQNTFKGVKVTLLYNTINQNFENAIKTSIIKRDNAFIIGFAGRITDVKNWPLCLKIVEELSSRIKDLHVHCVFSAYEDDEKAQMISYINKLKSILGVERFVSYIDVPQEEMPNFYQQLDVFVLTSKMESFGITAIEAMACDTSVIATRVGGLPEVVGLESNLYAENEYMKCVNKIVEYYNNRDILANDKEYFLSRFSNMFSLSAFSKNIVQIYESI